MTPAFAAEGTWRRTHGAEREKSRKREKERLKANTRLHIITFYAGSTIAIVLAKLYQRKTKQSIIA